MTICIWSTFSSIIPPNTNSLFGPHRIFGRAVVVKGFHRFTCTSTHLSANGMNHGFAFPAKAGPHFTDPGGMEG